MLGGGGFTSPGMNPFDDQLTLLDLASPGCGIHIQPLPPPFEGKCEISVRAAGSKGEIQFNEGPPNYCLEASHKLVWLEDQSTLQVQEKLNLVGSHPEITINGVPLELPKSFVAGHNIHVIETPSVPPTVIISAYPAGSDGEIQFARGGHTPAPATRFAASNWLKWNELQNRLEVQGSIWVNGIQVETPKDIVGGYNIQVVDSGGPPPTVTINALASGMHGAIQFNQTVLGQSRLAATNRLTWDSVNDRLEVQGDINLIDPTNGNYAYRINGVPFAWLNPVTLNQINLGNIAEINGAPFVHSQWIDIAGGGGIYYNSGRVGIGTAAPQAALDIIGETWIQIPTGNPADAGLGIFREDASDPDQNIFSPCVLSLSSRPGGSYAGFATGINAFGAAWMQTRGWFGNAPLLLNPLGGNVLINRSSDDGSGAALQVANVVSITSTTTAGASINAGIYFYGGGYGPSSAISSATPGTTTYFPLFLEGNPLLLNYGTQENVLLCATGGRVGIGTQAPQAALDVVGVIQSIVSNVISPSLPGAALASYQGIDGFFITSTDGATAVPLYILGSPLILQAFGQGGTNVGIGLLPGTAPQAMLDVNGGIFVTGFSTPTTGSGALLNIGDIGAYDFDAGDNLPFKLWGNPLILQGEYYPASSGSSGAIIFNTAAGVGMPPIERMRITPNNGNVGIGTLAPQAALDVAGMIQISYDTSPITNYLNIPNRFALSDIYGELILGDIRYYLSQMRFGSAGLNLQVTDQQTGTPVYAYLGTAVAGGNGTRVEVHSDGSSNKNIVFTIDGTRSAIIDTSGRVGIGTMAPQAALDVDGDIHCSGDIFASNLAMSDPGPGARKFWCDPADGHRVKFAA